MFLHPFVSSFYFVIVNILLRNQHILPQIFKWNTIAI
jgi:hypothetical protein